ncbi:hypothetical protein [Xylella fastidiosa]|uniref:Uncharacterized protein n=1 Tax=Xylella fastidiosa subsp. multiplex TaxID=644357 RepID=A0AAW6HW14_XYLFS|nr:hypothetical protein [Xylella fastidiosa]ERI59685.1 hypothetical protein M233_08340 [Xylella fastidiosa subsp. multiplex Griffin-1]KAJ4851898.1 hypothetical protein XYFPCFBP8418_008285 [Xylella fastidiosa subsp. multiplex]KFA40492.1 hypothetical protein DF22_002930 [Xylella fastidiosa]MBS9445372.1 hypothetical protein [Xylella fastidiosa subsp. multiplex]MBS9447377.1 hypothetical protein [Xylella fastidiosa subsp. multiplex]
MAWAKTILAAIANTLIEQRIQSEDLARLETREDLKFGEKAMTSAAKDGGLQNAEFGIFKDAGFRGMYNMTLRELQRYKRLPNGKTLYDFMGLEELAGNLFRVTQTAARIRNEVRRMMIENSGAGPEHLALEEDVKGVQKRPKNVDKAMKKLDKPKASKNSLSKPT